MTNKTSKGDKALTTVSKRLDLKQKENQSKRVNTTVLLKYLKKIMLSLKLSHG